MCLLLFHKVVRVYVMCVCVCVRVCVRVRARASVSLVYFVILDVVTNCKAPWAPWETALFKCKLLFFPLLYFYRGTSVTNTPERTHPPRHTQTKAPAHTQSVTHTRTHTHTHARTHWYTHTHTISLCLAARRKQCNWLGINNNKKAPINRIFCSCRYAWKLQWCHIIK